MSQSSSLYKIYEHSAKVGQIAEALHLPQTKIHCKGLLGSAVSFVLQSVFKKSEKPFLLVFNEKEEAAYYLNDLEQMLGANDVLFYPSSYRRPYQIEETDNANVLLRSEVLNRINSRKKPSVIVTYPEALFEKVVTRKELDKNTLKISVGENISIDFVNEVLFEYEFKRVDFITEPGEFSVRGGILDVFSFSNDNPYRIEFFGNEVDSIRTFDIETQLSVEKQNKITIIPNLENKFVQENRESFLDYISDKTVLCIENTEFVIAQLDKLFVRATETFDKLSKDVKHASPEHLFLNREGFLRKALDFSVIELSTTPFFKTTKSFEFHIQPQPSFNKQFDLLLNNLSDNHFNGFTNYLFCSNEAQANRFHDIFESLDEENHENVRKQYHTVVSSLYQGFIDEENQIACYTDHQIFERYHRFNIKNGYAKKQTITLKELTSLTVGDYVTHIDHGIGKFGGLQKIQVEGKTQEAIKLVYADND
ncbi:MAG: CarD family transcriptional regulator, partial [Flavobacterium sp.]